MTLLYTHVYMGALQKEHYIYSQAPHAEAEYGQLSIAWYVSCTGAKK